MPVRPVTLSPRSDLPLVEEGSLRMAPILGVPRLLEEMGVDPYALIAEVEIDPALFDNPENVVPFADLGRLLALCAARTRCPHFGLLVGGNAGLDVLGVLGQLALHSPDVGAALRSTILYLHLHDRGDVPTLSVCGGRAMLTYTIYQPDVPGTEQIYDAALAVTYNIMTALAGPDWAASDVLLYRPQPADSEPYRRFYQAPLSFSAEYQAVVFAAALDYSESSAFDRAFRRWSGISPVAWRAANARD